MNTWEVQEHVFVYGNIRKQIGECTSEAIVVILEDIARLLISDFSKELSRK